MRASFILIAVLAAAGTLLTWALGTVAGLEWLDHRSPLWRIAKTFVAIVTLWQWLGLIGWAGVTGLLVATGARRVPATRPRLVAALVMGALVPVGLLSLGGALGRLWPETDGPADAPVITLALVAYSIAVPWCMGRVLAALSPARA